MTPAIFFAFRDAPDRREALKTPGALDRYRLFGMDEIASRGAVVHHNLERARPAWARPAGDVANALATPLAGLGGDFTAVLPSLRAANGSDVVFGTVDTVAIPLVLLKRAGMLRRPLVYASIGLWERLDRLADEGKRARLRNAFRGVHTLVVYAEREADVLRDWLAPEQAPRVVFVPFGVDVESFRPDLNRPPTTDVVSVGADPRRDFDTLLRIAARHPSMTFHIVTTGDRARSLPRHENVTVETDVPLETVRDRIAEARVVALPVRDNVYSGATTVLLQAMASGKPVVVSRTDAIATGYELADGANCRLVPPGDGVAFERTLLETLTGADAARNLGIRARQTVERNFSWERYTSALWDVLVSATSPSARTS